MASAVDICNRALAKVGAARITSLNDSTPAARACNAQYAIIRDLVTESHPWHFATQRFQLAASATAPLFGFRYAYPLPDNWLKVLPSDAAFNSADRDWTIEDGSVLTDETAPLNVRVVMQVTDTTKMPPTYIEALACRLAMELCELMTQSNTKKADVEGMYKAAIADARKSNAIQSVPQKSPEDPWITARL